MIRTSRWQTRKKEKRKRTVCASERVGDAWSTDVRANGVHGMDLHSVVWLPTILCSPFGMAFSWCQLDILHNDSAHWLILLPTTDYGAQCFLWSTLQKWWPIHRCHFGRVRTNFNFSYYYICFFFLLFFASFICLRSRFEFHATHEIRVGVAECGMHTVFSSPFFRANFGCDCKTGVKMSCWHTFLRLHSINLFFVFDFNYESIRSQYRAVS